MTRSTEIQIAVMKLGLERATIKLLAELFERIAQCESNVREMSLIQLKGLEQLAQVVDGAGAMRTQIEKMRGMARDDDDDLPPTAN